MLPIYASKYAPALDETGGVRFVRSSINSKLSNKKKANVNQLKLSPCIAYASCCMLASDNKTALLDSGLSFDVSWGDECLGGEDFALAQLQVAG